VFLFNVKRVSDQCIYCKKENITPHMFMNTYIVFLISASILAKAKYSTLFQAFTFALVRHIHLSLQESTIGGHHAGIQLPIISANYHLHILMEPCPCSPLTSPRLGGKK